jgi:plasmid stability protein
MANLTVTVDDQVLKRARIRALENGTSVNAVVTDYLRRYAGVGGTQAGLAGFVDLARKSEAGSGPEGRTWRREDLYDRPKYLHRK